MKNYFALGMLCAALMMFSCSEEQGVPIEKDLDQYSSAIILEWNQIVHETMGGDDYLHGLLASRMYAMVHLAMHDAINAVVPKYSHYAHPGKNPKAEAQVAASYAAHEILSATFPDQKMTLDGHLNRLIGFIQGEGRTEGEKLGKAVAATFLALREEDGAFQDPIGAVEFSEVPGVYQAVPPLEFVFAPFWKEMKLFGLKSHSQFRSVPPPALDSEKYTTDFNEVKEKGYLNSTTRTEDQRRYAMFWEELSEMGWNKIARTAVVSKSMNLTDAARLFALLNIALADSYTAGWDSKFYYNFWRPFTAIRNAANDGNPQTVADQNWEPLLPTPPVQDYPSTHSALGNAGAYVLGSLLGDQTTFSFVSTTGHTVGASRTFTSFSQAANENADSRVMAGFHFRFACEAGQELGNKVGEWVINQHLRPL